MKIENVKELKNIAEEVVRVISDHIKKTNDTPTGFANKVGVHPLQMLGFLRRERGMHIDTIAKIGTKINEKNK